MAIVTESISLATRRRILKEYKKVQTKIATKPKIWRKLSFEAHEKICGTMGDDFIDYPEFEFWFSRFIQGNFDLDYDRSADPKTRSFTDLPLDVFENIAKYLELEDRMQLRDVCKDIRYQVDDWDPKVTEFFYFNANRCKLRHKSRFQLYCPRSVLKLPKLQLEKLKIHKQDKYWEKLIEELDRTNRKLHVKKVVFSNYYLPPTIDLHFMIPGVLEQIKMFRVNPNCKEMYEMIASEQFQAAKMVYIDSLTPTSQFPLDALYQCRRFTLRVGERPADGLKAAFIKKLMKYEKVEKCVIYAQRHIMRYFNEPEAMIPNFPSLRRYPIPDTDEFYELEYRVDFVRLKKKQ